MEKKRYGSTWWGQEWLKALSNIDFSNRLPTGRNYASTGKVRSIDIKSNQIIAKVQGTQPSPYRVDISAPVFSEDEKKRLLSEIARNPDLVAKILNKDLPTELLQIAEKQNIHIFPHSWRDFSMHCSCPELAVPCKHLAAVIFSLAVEIDRNPFLLFDLHGLDLVKTLESKDIHIVDARTEHITQVGSLFTKKSNGTRKIVSTTTDPPDFTTIPYLGDDIPALFKPQTPFFNGDFNTIIKKLYAGAENTARRLLDGNFEARQLEYTLQPEDQLKLIFDQNLFFRQLTAHDRKGQEKPLKNSRPEDLIQILLDWDPDMLLRTHPHTVALYDVLNFSLVLAKQGAIVPQLLECEPGTFRIRWLPATIHQAVGEVFDKMAQNLPPGLLTATDGKESYCQAPPEILNSLCSFFIGFCVAKSSDLDSEPLVRLFRFTTSGKPATIPDSKTQRQLHRWHKSFYLGHKDFVPMVKVEELRGHFAVDILVEYRPDPAQVPIPLADILQKKKYTGVRFEVLRDLKLLADFFPQLAKYAEAQGLQLLVFNEVEFADIFLNILPTLRLFGIRISLPKRLEHIVRPQATLLAKKSLSRDEDSFFHFDDLVDFEWQVALDEEILTIRAFEEIITNLNGIVKIRDQYVLVDEEALINLFERFEEQPELGEFQALQILLAGEYEGTKISLSAEAAALIRKLIQPGRVPLPKGLRATLRPYQRSGYEWMLKNARLGFGSLIADDLGMGKTLQVIATLLKFKEEGFLQKKKALVIVPNSLPMNWRREIEKFAPSLVAAIYHGQKRSLGVVNPDVIITTYDIVRNELELLQKMEWYCAVIDEAQNIKNADAAHTKAVKAIPATVHIAMISTPLENRLSEFWSIMDFTNRGYLRSQKQFKETFSNPIQVAHSQHRTELLRKITAPFFLRRLKSDKSIILDLPEKIETTSYAGLTAEQVEIYENVVQENMAIISGEGDQIKRQSLIANMITSLKQICNHPFQFLKKGGTTPGLSGKSVLLLSLLDTIYENGEKTLIFTQSREMGDLLRSFLADEFGREPLFLHEDTARSQAEEMVEVFQNDPYAHVFILAMKASAAGLNLTGVSNVIHYDRWLNPAIEDQVTDRAFRPGQKIVTVWRLITQGTFEEKIHEMLQEKKDLANLTVATGENWIGNLTNEELSRLVAFGG